MYSHFIIYYASQGGGAVGGSSTDGPLDKNIYARNVIITSRGGFAVGAEPVRCPGEAPREGIVFEERAGVGGA